MDKEADFLFALKILNIFAYCGFTWCHVHLTSCDVIVSLVARERIGKTFFVVI